MSATATAAKTAATSLDLVRVAGRIGAEVRGVKLSGDLDAGTAAAIKEALHQHKVLFFRGQTHLDDAAQEKLTPIFGGKPVNHPTVPVVKGSNHIHELDSRYGGRANSWHTDVTFVDAYPQASILRGVAIPAFGGDTVWANTAAAYQSLTPELRELADKLWAVHSNEYDYQHRKQDNVSDEIRKLKRDEFTSTVYETEHPLVRVHPITGERTLLLGHFFKHFVGSNAADSAALFRVFQDHITKLENTVRWRWAVGDVVVWDNRATQHYAINDYGDQVRIVRRVTVDGDVPVAIDGRRSVTRLVRDNKTKAA
ncbi:MAG TPA: TauD/TfdA family dioxygenase [Planctomycetota bacterium]|nr:TauD/TfdA family dioxygenase [Planctomycetota bacterium]